MKVFSLRSLLTAVSCFAAFSLAACEPADDDDAGLGDGGLIEENDGSVSEGDGSVSESDAATVECTTADDCAARDCNTVACNDNTCVYTSIDECCTESTQCTSTDVCEVGSCSEENTCDFSKVENAGALGGCCSENTQCESGVCDLANNKCVECLTVDDCTAEITACESKACVANKCEVTWDNALCCVAEGEGENRVVTGCNFADDDDDNTDEAGDENTDENGNSEEVVEPVVKAKKNAKKLSKSVTDYECYVGSDTRNLFVSGGEVATGVCASKAAVDECNEGCSDNEFAFECVETAAGAAQRTHVGYCTVDMVQRAELGLEAGELYCGYTEDLCTVSAECQLPVCHANGKDCSAKAITACCVVTVDEEGNRGFANGHACADGQGCYNQTGSLVGDGESGICVKDSVIESRCGNCLGRDFCATDGSDKLMHSNFCTVDPEFGPTSSSQVTACAAAEVVKDCAEDEKVCVESSSEVVESKAVVAACLEPVVEPEFVVCTAEDAAEKCTEGKKCYEVNAEGWIKDVEVTGEGQGICYDTPATPYECTSSLDVCVADGEDAGHLEANEGFAWLYTGEEVDKIGCAIKVTACANGCEAAVIECDEEENCSQAADVCKSSAADDSNTDTTDESAETK